MKLKYFRNNKISLHQFVSDQLKMRWLRNYRQKSRTETKQATVKRIQCKVIGKNVRFKSSKIYVLDIDSNYHITTDSGYCLTEGIQTN